MVGGFFKLRQATTLPVRVDSKIVALEARENMEVGVEYFLEGGFTVGQEQVHSLTAKATSTKGHGESVADAKHMCARFRLQFLKIGGVVFRNDKDMARIHRTDIHESEHVLVLEDDV